MKPFQTLLFYKYARVDNAEAYKDEHLAFCKSLNLMGRVLIGDEGINGTVSGTIDSCKQYMDYLSNDARFTGIEFKIDEEDAPSFSKMHVRYKKEIVHFGQPDVNVWEMTGRFLEPNEWQKQMHDPDAVVIDMRNMVEWEAGKFKNAVTLDVDTFRDIPNHLDELEQYKDKKILAYCTGGIRCEKATAFLIQRGFKNVFHLHGGIIRYGKEAGGKDFDGKCYVFDNRLTVDVNTVNPEIISHCRKCNSPSVHFINCANPECNEHFILCETCATEMEGSCSEECKAHPRRRIYDGTGYYQKHNQEYQTEKARKKWMMEKVNSRFEE